MTRATAQPTHGETHTRAPSRATEICPESFAARWARATDDSSTDLVWCNVIDTLPAKTRQLFSERYSRAASQRAGCAQTLETPEEIIRRVAADLADVECDVYGATESARDDVHHALLREMLMNRFTPAGRTLKNAGADTPTVANCVVLAIPDSLDGIFDTLRRAVKIQSAGSGIGFCFSALRPRGSAVGTNGGKSSGPIPFLGVYDKAFREIKQHGRHGANMATFRVDHPDFLEFLHCKRREGALVTFNISVLLTDDFMLAAAAHEPQPAWCSEWNGVSAPMRRYDSASDTMCDTHITARELLREIAECAWDNGEPGVLFPDRANSPTPLPKLGREDTTNPCGEQFLAKNDVCNLGSMNLAAFVDAYGEFDYLAFGASVHWAMRALDNVIDRYQFPDAQVDAMARYTRRVGLGVMGVADMFIHSGVRYGSPESLRMLDRVMQTFDMAAHSASELLALARGACPCWPDSAFADARVARRRNLLTTCAAPSGSIAPAHGVWGGIEPLFSLIYRYENTSLSETLCENVSPHLESLIARNGMQRRATLDAVVANGSSVRGLKLAAPQDELDVLVGAHDITPSQHLSVQEVVQRNIDNSCSKTVNLPYSATVTDVLTVYMRAWHCKLKGCCVYRNGSRTAEVLVKSDGGATPGGYTSSGDEVSSLDEICVEIVPDRCTSGGCG